MKTNSTNKTKTHKSYRIFDWIDILLYLFMAFQFIRLWVSPSPDDAELVYYFAILMAFEFILAHSGVFMAIMPPKVSILIFFPIYGLFALCFTSMIGDLSIVWVYLIVVFNRMRFAFMNVDPDEKMRVIGMSALTAIIYFFLIFIIAFCSGFIPELGLTKDYLEQSGYENIKTIGGLFTDEPNVPMCFGAIYYILIALMEFKIKK